MAPRMSEAVVYAAVLALAGVALIGAGCGSPASTATAGTDSNAASQAQIDDLQQQVNEQKTATANLEAELNRTKETLDVRTAMLEGLLREAKQRDQSEAQSQDLQKRLDGLKSLSATLLNDRDLLVELRKEPPAESTEELLVYWRNVRELAVKSDPALVRPADRLLTAAEAFARWIDTEYASEDEAAAAYYASGADQYPTRVTEFSKAALLVLIFRLEGVIQQTQ